MSNKATYRAVPVGTEQDYVVERTMDGKRDYVARRGHADTPARSNLRECELVIKKLIGNVWSPAFCPWPGDSLPMGRPANIFSKENARA